jgi:large subunit ribosomal protein L10
MPKTRAQKEAVISQLTQAMTASANGVFTDFERITMVDLDAFRALARAQGVSYTVVKPTLVQIAAKQAGIDGLAISKTGKSYGLALGGHDEVSLAKLVNDFAKKSDDRVHIALGIIDGQIVSAETVKQLASLPSYNELMGRVVGSMQAPISNFVYSLNWNLQSFYNVIKAIESKG